MAVIEQERDEQEAVREIRIQVSRQQEETLTHAASEAGQSLEEFAASALARAADAPRERLVLPAGRDPLDSIIGIFKDSPELDALMERIHEEQRQGIEEFRLEAEAEEAAEQAEVKTINVFT